MLSEASPRTVSTPAARREETAVTAGRHGHPATRGRRSGRPSIVATGAGGSGAVSQQRLNLLFDMMYLQLKEQVAASTRALRRGEPRGSHAVRQSGCGAMDVARAPVANRGSGSPIPRRRWRCTAAQGRARAVICHVRGPTQRRTSNRRHPGSVAAPVSFPVQRIASDLRHRPFRGRDWRNERQV